MSYLVLARKYRPQTFADVIGQSEITDKLKNALACGRTAHAYLFCGPRGVGKTTCARILAMELNKNTPAGSSQGSLDLGMQTALDIIEIDGASNNSVDDIRALRDSAQLMPMGGGVKIYIIDEVHMLSPAAFNALLKTLEEPPKHVKFVFATTDPNKLPLTVVSRCQRFDFRRIPLEQMAGSLKSVCFKEGFNANEDALFAIARASQGSMRDALSVLDQLSSASSGKIDLAEVNAMLGIVEIDQLFALAEALLLKNFPEALKILDNIAGKGKSIKQLSQDLVGFFRNLMVMKAGGPELQDLIDHSASYKKMLFDLVGLVSMAEILAMIDRLVESQDTARIIEMPQLALEIALARITLTANSGAGNVPLAAVPLPVNAAVPVKPAAVVPGMILNNNRGMVSIEPIKLDNLANAIVPIPAATNAPTPQAAVNPPASPAATTSMAALANIVRNWNTLTHNVCQQSMSVGTYLQEGRPLKFDGRKLTIGFTPDNEFHKEFLDQPANLKVLRESVAQAFSLDVVIDLVITEETDTYQVAAAVNDALAIFGGEVVNEWDSDDGLSKSN
ncbi:MAG: DNA polymerase III subunit gamma/tau [Candidatus Omnitrophica bacterium]|nr:DNA polymerase III subunit gamma/tau [Candidatus Omnitrophota bacterium]